MIRFSFLLILISLIACGEPEVNQQSSQPETEASVPEITNDSEPQPTNAIDSTSTSETTDSRFKFPYDLGKPNKEFKLPGRLTEISGLSLTQDEQTLVAVNDEQGKLFFIDRNSGEVTSELRFGKNNDYEGVEVVEDKIYVVKNSGTIYRVKNVGQEDQKTKDYPNELDARYDVEGLGWDAKNDRLLIACKGKAGKGDEFKKTRAIYAFDLDKKGFSVDPVYLVAQKDIEKFVEVQKEKGLPQKLVEFLDPDAAADAFAPSGIAVHPNTRDVYILSSVGKLLVILNKAGTIQHIEKLDRDIHRQPEGICFDKNGVLFISNEGKNSKGKIYTFIPG